MWLDGDGGGGGNTHQLARGGRLQVSLTTVPFLCSVFWKYKWDPAPAWREVCAVVPVYLYCFL